MNGGIVDLPCGELDVNATTNGGGTPTGTTATINGGIDIQASDVCTIPGAFSDADIWTVQINGGISITGTYTPGFEPFICHNQIKGNMDVHSATAPAGFVIGDPDEGITSCVGNTISGAFIMSNSSTFEVESNAIGGSVLLSASTLELNGNAIGGSLKCSDGTVILPPNLAIHLTWCTERPTAPNRSVVATLSGIRGRSPHDIVGGRPLFAKAESGSSCAKAGMTMNRWAS